MIRYIYLFVYYLMILLITLFTTTVVIASHPQTVDCLAKRFLNENGIGYSSIEGTLLNGVTLHDINYQDALLITRLEVKYNIFMLLKPTPTLKTIKIEGSSLILDKLPENEENEGTPGIPAFAVTQLQLHDSKVFVGGDTITFDLNASKIDYRRKLNVKKLALQLNSSYGDATVQGEVRSNRLYTQSSLTPKASLVQKHLSSIQGLPTTLSLDLEAGEQDVQIRTHIEDLKMKEQNASLYGADIMLRYFIKEEHLTFNAKYGLSYDTLHTEIRQTALYRTAGDYTSELNATVTCTPFALPFKSFRAELSGDKERMQGRLNAGPLQLGFKADSYNQINIHAKSEALPLSFLPDLPALLEKDSIAFEADARIDTKPFALKGTFDAQGLYGILDGSFEADNDEQLLLATLTPKPESKLWENYPITLFSPFDFVYYMEHKQEIINLDANMLNVTLFKADRTLNGWGNIGSGYFDISGEIGDRNRTRLDLTAGIASLHAFMSEFGFTTQDEKLMFDAQADINATLAFTDTINVKSRIHLPWYMIKPDTQTHYQGEDVYLESTLADDKITIDRYSLNIKDHHIYSQRPSHIAFDANGTLLLREFWVYDNLLLSGTIDPSQMQGELHLQSERFNYASKEGNVTLKADITADLKSGGEQTIEGEITLLEGIVTYEPKTDYTISDDVVIIQDIKPYTPFKRFVNIHINALKPIRYKTKEMDIRFVPDIILWQEPSTPLSIYGIVAIEDGEVIGSGKRFTLNKSEIYFNGSNPVNPYLNLNIHHQTLNYIDIQIDVTNTLSAPVVILSSNPALSQNDIMSYILFSEPASSAFGGSAEKTDTFSASSLLLATGLKQIVNDTSGVNIDTLNILTNEEGTLGYEIGTRFSKNIRVLYKNDTVSSVILQYSLSRSIRLDVDVHETGQGVSILYVKDF